MRKELQFRITDLLERGSLEADFFSTLHRFVYEMANVYAISMDLDGRVLSSFVCSERETEYVKSILTESMLEDTIRYVENNFFEEVVPVSVMEDGAVCQAIVIQMNKRPAAVMFILGLLEEKIQGDKLPEGIKKIPTDHFDGVIETLTKQIHGRIEAAVREYNSSLKVFEANEERAQMEAEFFRSAIVTEIVQKLESEEEIVDVVSDILEKVGKHLEIDVSRLYRINKDSNTVSIISEWCEDERFIKKEKEQSSLIEENPFMKEENYIISSNTALKDNQKGYLEKAGFTSVAIFPIRMEQQVIMYLEFACVKKERIWEIEGIRFLSDVRKIIQSIIIKRVTQNSLSSSLATLEDMMENIGSGVVVIQPGTRQVLFSNRLLTPELRDYLERINLNDLYFGENGEVEFYIKELGLWLLFNRAEISWVDGEKVELYTFYDITQNKLNEQSIEKSFYSDFLTGLYNRMRCEQDLKMYLDLANRSGGKGAVLFLDLDDFKHINEGLGHQYGDILLKAISSNLRRIPGVESNCYRVGGDEFIVIVTNKQFEDLEFIIESVKEIFSHPWYLKGDEYYCTMSMGVCKFPKDATTADEAIRNADATLFEAKREGKNRVNYYDGRSEMTNLRRLDMEKYMRDACANPEEEFEVYYQPIIDISKKGDPCVGAEALLRWNSKGLGRVAPSDFVPLAEYLGLIKPIGDYVLRKACEDCKRWNDLGHPDYKVNVNFSVVQLLQSDMEEKIAGVLEETGLRPKNLTVEVTESLAINDIVYMKDVLSRIRKLGVRVALDDFGTGYSSLNHIHEMPIDIIKVDRCFVKDVGQEEYSQVFVKMVSELAKVMGMNVCVEGVEDDKQYEIMKENGINMIQGFYFAEPMPCKEFELKFVD